jgi:hypothetical protein
LQERFIIAILHTNLLMFKMLMRFFWHTICLQMANKHCLMIFHVYLDINTFVTYLNVSMHFVNFALNQPNNFTVYKMLNDSFFSITIIYVHELWIVNKHMFSNDCLHDFLVFNYKGCILLVEIFIRITSWLKTGRDKIYFFNKKLNSGCTIRLHSFLWK